MDPSDTDFPAEEDHQNVTGSGEKSSAEPFCGSSCSIETGGEETADFTGDKAPKDSDDTVKIELDDQPTDAINVEENFRKKTPIIKRAVPQPSKSCFI